MKSRFKTKNFFTKRRCFMRKKINNVIYDTKTSIFLGYYHYTKDSQEILESLYLSPDGRFFIHYRAGPQNSYSRNGESYSCQRIILFDDKKGLEWCRHLLPIPEEEFKSIKRLKAFLRNNTGL